MELDALVFFTEMRLLVLTMTVNYQVDVVPIILHVKNTQTAMKVNRVV